MSRDRFDTARRSTRVFMCVRVIVAGKDADGRRFRQACETVVINAHGGLLRLGKTIQDGALLNLTNPFTQEEMECRVVFVGSANENGQRVGVEFLTPAPHFWGVDFMPADWPVPPAPVSPG